MQLIILSGLSGAGKSVALHMLEDLGYYCIDNMPAALLKSFIAHSVRSSDKIYARTAISLDARNSDAEIASVPTLVDELKRSGIDCEVLFLIAGEAELLRRFAETRRVHPLSRQGETLREAIASERALLEPIAACADQVLDTSQLGVHQLREHDPAPRRPALDRSAVAAVRILRLQARHTGRRRFRLRRALAPQSLLGEHAAAADRA